MNHLLNRRNMLMAGAASAWPLRPVSAQERKFAPSMDGWRTFEVTTTVTVANVQGATGLWLPVPDVDSPWQRSLGNDWAGNASQARLVSDAGRGVRMLHAEFPATVSAPSAVLTSRVQTRNRAVNWAAKNPMHEDPAVLRANLQPTDMLPLDGIVHKTALEATRGAQSDIEKVRAIYAWVVANAYREPKTRGCGNGDIKAMLEIGNLGGKCADLNAIFVGLCRSVRVPARDIYGLRVAPSAFGYKELGATSANLKGAQHCRAEAYLRGYGWVAMDPADVLKVMRQETTEWIRDPRHPVAAPVMAGLFGSWEGNWVGWNTGHDVTLPGSAGQGTLPFLMYPNGENAGGRFDELAPDSFRYTISAREIAV